MRRVNLLFLNGTSSAGKTSLARELQALLPQPYFRLSSDDLFPLLHPRFLQPGTPERESVRFPMVRAYYHTLSTFLSLGNHVIADTIFIADWPDIPAMRAVNLECLSLLQPYPVYCIGVVCSLEELERRERERGNRGIGTAKAQYAAVHAPGCYDLTVNTAEQSTHECAQEIAAFMSQCENPDGLQRLYQQMLKADSTR